MPKKERLFLIDGSALAYRSHFAMADASLSDAEGRPTGATYAFLTSLLKLIDDERPEHLAVAIDPKTKTFRHERFTAYKATRQKMPDELVAQLPWMEEAIAALGIPLVQVEGYEADDVIGTLAVEGARRGLEVLIVTGDKDFMQIVSDDVKLYNIFKRNQALELVGVEQVREKFGVDPPRVVDVLALMGDASDNVPGVKGIGEKTAIALIQEHGSLEQVLERAAELPGKRAREGLLEHRDDALLSKDLVTIRTDVDLAIDPASLALSEPDEERMATLCRQLELTTLLKRFTKRAANLRTNYVVVRDAAGLQELVATLRAAGRFTMDSETTALDAHHARLVGMSFCIRSGTAWYVPFNATPPVLDGGPAALLDVLRPLLEDESLRKNGQNVKYDAIVLHRAGVNVRGIAFDTMLGSYCVDPGSHSHGLDALSLKYFNYKKIETSELIGTGRNQTTMDLLPIDEVGKYACEDADFTQRLVEVLEPEIEAVGAQRVFYELEMPLLDILLRMELRGVRVDPDRLTALDRDMRTRARKLTEEIYDLAGRSFTINSPKQLGEVLFEELQIQEGSKKKLKRTKTGYATDATTLEHFAAHPIVAKILEYRTQTKLLSTYVEALPRLIHEETGRIHTSYNQAVAATGRLSSSDPNLQNIPIRTPLGREIRKAFVTEPGWKLVSADYSQIELRLVAHMSGDERLLEAFRRQADIHAQTAAFIFGLPMEQVQPEQRSQAKAINFGIIYGMGAQRLSQTTNLSLAEAKEFIQAYFETFPGVRRFLDVTLDRARETGYAETLLGRRRRIPDINSTRPGLRVAAENVAVNTPVQGTAADLMKLAMIAVDAGLCRAKYEAHMLLQVHDELVFETPAEHVEALSALVRDAMENAMELDVPLVVDLGCGENWLDAH